MGDRRASGARVDRWRGEAPAKVNLRLHVLERDASGYHRIDTVFQTLSLADVIELEWAADDVVSIEVAGVDEGALGPPDQNLAVRAAARFRESMADRGRAIPGVRVRLIKLVPHGAGLGGGSSDAATVLRGLNELMGGSLPEDDVLEIGAGLGSDIPFFVAQQARMRGEGRGDRLTALPPLPSRPVLLALPRTPVATAWAYRTLAETRAPMTLAAARAEDAPADVRTGASRASSEPDEWAGTAAEAHNDFEEVLFPLRPDLRATRDALAAAGAEIAMLSGSGSAVFAVFGSARAADCARNVLATQPSAPWIRMIRTATVG